MSISKRGSVSGTDHGGVAAATAFSFARFFLTTRGGGGGCRFGQELRNSDWISVRGFFCKGASFKAVPDMFTDRANNREARLCATTPASVGAMAKKMRARKNGATVRKGRHRSASKQSAAKK